MGALDQVIRRDLDSSVPLINAVGEYIIAAGGKRIRPFINHALWQTLGNDSALLYKIARWSNTFILQLYFMMMWSMNQAYAVDAQLLMRCLAMLPVF